MKKITLIALVLITFSMLQLSAQKKSEEDNLKPYFFVILKKGPHRDQDSAMAAQIQKGHIDSINKLAAAGKLNVAGPFLDEGEMRGIFIFDSGSEEEVRSFVDNDPAVKAGRLVYEIHPWMTQKGTCFK